MSQSPRFQMTDYISRREMLRAPDVQRRIEACQAIAQISGRLGDQLLISALADSERVVRQTAAGFLQDRFSAEVIGELAELLRIENSAARNEAMSLLTVAGLAETGRSGNGCAEDGTTSTGGGVVLANLIERLLDPDPDVRIFAANVLGRIGAAQAAPSLLKHLSDPHENVRYAIAEALGDVGHQDAVPHLLAILGQDEWVQIAAIEALGKLKDSRATPQLEAMLSSDPWLRASLVEALGRIGSPSTADSLLPLLADPNPMVSYGVIAALGRIDQRHQSHTLQQISPKWLALLQEALKERDPAVVQAAGIALGWLGDASVLPDLTKLLGTENQDRAEIATASIVQIGRRSPSQFFQFLTEMAGTVNSELDREREEQAFGQAEQLYALLPAVAQIGGAQGTQILLSLAQGAQLLDLRAKALALLTLCALSPSEKDATFSILPHFAKAPEVWMREVAAHALRDLLNQGMAVTDALQFWLQIVADPVPQVRLAAAEAMALHATPELIQQMGEMLPQADPLLADGLLQTLGQIRTPQAMEALLPTLGSPHPSQRQIVVRILGQDGALSWVDPLCQALQDGDWQVRKSAAEALARYDHPKPIAPLLTALSQDEQMWVRYAAAVSLGEIQPTDASSREQVVEALCHALENDLPPIQLGAMTSLGRLARADTLDALASFATHADSDFRAAVAEALSHFSDEEATDLLVRLSQDSSERVRRMATQGLESKRTVKGLHLAQGVGG